MVQWGSLLGFHWLGARSYYLRKAEWRAALLLLFLGAGLVLVQPCAGGSIFNDTGSLAIAREYHTATLLPNGETLVAGGFNYGTGVLRSAELYNPASGLWTLTSSLAFPRANSTGTLLPNGNVLVAGGENVLGSGYLASAELYDPESGTWSITGRLATERSYHTATLLLNGKVLVVGGVTSFNVTLASAELYDPVSGIWTATGSLAIARGNHTATLLPNGKVLVAAGSAGPTILASAELYDPASGTWSVTGRLGAARYHDTATLLPNGKVLVAGGYYAGSSALTSAELYDPASGTWSFTGDLVTARGQFTATLLPDGKVLVAAGSSGGYLASAELYDPASGLWTPTGSLANARANPTATLLPNGRVLVVAGDTGFQLASGELYLGPPTRPTLLNISTRVRVLTGDHVLIGGFVITGTDLKRVLIRGIGPSLNGVGVTLSDPTLELHRGSTMIATNDNWKTRSGGSSQQADIEATTIPPTNDLESAILMMLSPGTYTAILAGKDGGTGVGLIEVYDLGQGSNSKPANISTRGFVDTGDNVMIGGLIVGGGSGSGMARVLLRALGPSIPVAGALVDPMLELHDESGTTINFNDNWKTGPGGISQQAEIEATGIPPTNNLESAILQTLAPGSYTMIVRGVNGTIGVGLVEAYNLQ
jgi:hypothetical protein